PDEWQVFLEQGLGLGYRFDVDSVSMSWLRRVAAYTGIPAATMTALAAAFADAAHPAALDLQLRKLWLTLHARARVHDAGLDGAYFTGLSAALALGGDVENVATALEALLGGDQSLTEMQAAIDSATKLLRDLSAVAKPAGDLLPSPLDRNDFWSSFPLDLAQ